MKGLPWFKTKNKSKHQPIRVKVKFMLQGVKGESIQFMFKGIKLGLWNKCHNWIWLTFPCYFSELIFLVRWIFEAKPEKLQISCNIQSKLLWKSMIFSLFRWWWDIPSSWSPKFHTKVVSRWSIQHERFSNIINK